MVNKLLPVYDHPKIAFNRVKICKTFLVNYNEIFVAL